MPAYSKKRAYAPKKKISKKKAAPKKKSNLVKLIKSITLKESETKYTNQSVVKTELYHNTYTNLGDIFAKCYPLQGVRDDQRIGDSIVQRGIKMRFLLGQKYDRPNVTFKLWLLKIPRSQSLISFPTMFDQETGNVLLDSTNSDNVKVIWTKTIHRNYPNLSAAVPGTVESREITFPIQQYLKLQRKVTFVSDGSTDQGYTDTDHVLIATCYDAFGTLSSDNCAYIQTFLRYYYKDP